MRTVPRRVACYYKFNVKWWWQKMREKGGRRRGGGKRGDSSSASGMEAFIFPFLLVSKCAQRGEKIKREWVGVGVRRSGGWGRGGKPGKADRKRRGIISQRRRLFHPLVWYKWPSWAAVYCIHQCTYGKKKKKHWPFVPLAAHLWGGGGWRGREGGEEEQNIKLYLFLTVIYRCTFLRVSSVMKAPRVIRDKVFHSLSVSDHCGRVSVSAERTTPERGHCSAPRCQRRRGPSRD